MGGHEDDVGDRPTTDNVKTKISLRLRGVHVVHDRTPREKVGKGVDGDTRVPKVTVVKNLIQVPHPYQTPKKNENNKDYTGKSTKQTPESPFPNTRKNVDKVLKCHDVL